MGGLLSTTISIEEREGGAEEYLEDIAWVLMRKDYKPQAVRYDYLGLDEAVN